MPSGKLSRNLNIAVLDGQEPETWRPWGAKEPNVEEALVQILAQDPLGAGAVIRSVVEVKIAPVVCAPHRLLTSNVDPIVGLVVDPTRFENGLIQDFEKLCLRLAHATERNYRDFGMHAWILGSEDYSELKEKMKRIFFRELGGNVAFEALEVRRKRRLEQSIREFAGTCHLKLQYRRRD